MLLNTKTWLDGGSAHAWIKYGILILKMIELYECRADAWTKYGLQITRFYKYALAAFEQALHIEPNHSVAVKYQDTVQRKWEILREKLEQIKPCRVCQYYHGKDSITCALHPSGRPEDFCRDWELD